MIKAVQKGLEEIREMLTSYQRVLVVGCNTCVAVCFAGGEKEVESLTSMLSLKDRKEGISREYLKYTVQRQCENEFVDPIEEEISNCDAVLSTACGIGAQTMADRFPDLPVFPALDTTFLGRALEPGYFFEYCVACGNCILGMTGGICPIARCAKSLLNGPCGGSQGGKCEISKDIPCAWHQIYERLDKLGSLENMEKINAPKTWSASSGPRIIVREDLRVVTGEVGEAAKDEE